MNQRTKLVLIGILQLNDSERKELITEWNRIVENNSSGQKGLSVSESELQSVVLGPLNERCPCCGK